MMPAGNFFTNLVIAPAYNLLRIGAARL